MWDGVREEMRGLDGGRGVRVRVGVWWGRVRETDRLTVGLPLGTLGLASSGQGVGLARVEMEESEV